MLRLAASQESNNTGNATQQNADFVNSILAVHNHERTAVGVPPLAWSDKLAADAKTEAEYLVTVGKLTHEGCGWCNGSGNLGRRHGLFDGTANAGLGQRKSKMAQRHDSHGSELVSYRSLHPDGLEDHDPHRLRDRQWWWNGLSVVPLQPAGQLHGEVAVLGVLGVLGISNYTICCC